MFSAQSLLLVKLLMIYGWEKGAKTNTPNSNNLPQRNCCTLTNSIETDYDPCT